MENIVFCVHIWVGIPTYCSDSTLVIFNNKLRTAYECQERNLIRMLWRTEEFKGADALWRTVPESYR